MALVAVCRLVLCQLVLGVCAGAHVVNSSVANVHSSTPSAQREAVAGTTLAKISCDAAVNLDDLQLGLSLGSQFLVRSQQAAGNFHYEYNWLSQAEVDDDSAVRQAGTLWVLTLLHVDQPKSERTPAIRKAFQYFDKHSAEFSGGLRKVIYPGQKSQNLGAVALLALAHIEVLRRPEVLESAKEKQLLETHLAGYLKTILAARTHKNNFHKNYDNTTGKHFGPPWAFYDGQSLLALVKAAKYLGHDHLWPHIKASADAGWRQNVLLSLEANKKGRHSKKEVRKRLGRYYQWGSMSWYELLGTKDADFTKYSDRMLRCAHWALGRSKRASKGQASRRKHPDAAKGFAFEGLIPAFVTAVQQGDQHLTQELGCAIRKGVENLHSRQVGHTKASALAELFKKPGDVELCDDPRAQGGVQSLQSSPTLRIDTTQHQLHALLMARRLLQRQALI